VFNRLDYDTQREISELGRGRPPGALGHALEVTPEAVEFLIRESSHKTLGARPMRGTVEPYLQKAIAERVIAGSVSSGYIQVSDCHRRLVLK
jgi:ATP-dependent Clp protease ATP-binding subunit ClpA